MAQERRGRGGRGGDGRNKDSDAFESVVQIKRCAAVVKGGRRFSFNALVVVGDRKGKVAFGYGKAKEVPPAVEKAVKSAHKALAKIPLRGKTIPHKIIGRYGAARVIMLPAAPGTGVIAGRGVRDVMVACGVTDVLTKCMGSTNPVNVVKATINGLKQMRTRDEVAELRGVTL
ncbi:30S ribosomal protein S5 [Planctomycetes bacterium Pan216]|uniref:Small ribosomal subunit protein uS5 n=1 Tax=Kolteria novifilia TaxID=2527975 RepID=A0A518AZJ9_9BACT|nr:30S ribosomal protein S5 [Planctomycetes bacterium Pan216]